MPEEIYLQPTYYLDFDHPMVQQKVKQLTDGSSGPNEAIRSIFHFIRDDIPYNMYAVSGNQIHYKASGILERGYGYCLQKAILFTAMSRAVGVPGRLVLVSIRNHLTPPDVVQLLGSNLFFPHAYSQFFLDGHWINVAATYDQPLCERIGAAVPEFDGHTDTLLPKTDLRGRRFIEYVDNYGEFDNLPWDLIVSKMPNYYSQGLEYWFGEELVSVRYKQSGSGIG